MLWIFYAYMKTGEFLIITINSFGCVVEVIYLVIYITYCPKKARVFTLRLILLLNFGGFCIIVLLTHLLAKERQARFELLGWICVRVVIRTKSVEFMPFTLSLLLTASALMWLLYGIFLRDIYVTLPNIVGLAFGTIQMVLYLIYRNHKPPVQDQVKVPENKGDIENVVVEPVIMDEKKETKDQTEHNNNNNNNKTGEVSIEV
ncbi:bidirectional sugar transporter N3-like [Senna tora]|uniref:Sugar transporter SWEET1 n=1 Tax=Senna tora TaxID=362788 RepID=A0A834WWH0_9FABA|nr:bidirectional sugar transporter N3-like [Senna tora]